MKWRPTLTAMLVLTLSSCGGSVQDPETQPNVTVLGTSVDSGQPTPTIGSAVSTARE